MKPILWGNYAGSTMPLRVVIAYQAYQLRIQLDSPILANVAQYPQLRVSPVKKIKCYYTENILLMFRILVYYCDEPTSAFDVM